MTQDLSRHDSSQNLGGTAEALSVPSDDANEFGPRKEVSQKNGVTELGLSPYALEEHAIDETPNLKVCQHSASRIEGP